MSLVSCVKCKKQPSYFTHRDFLYCKECFIEQFKHKLRFAINSKPKLFVEGIEQVGKPSSIAITLWDTIDSLSLLKYVLFYEYEINSKYKNISYLFVLYTPFNQSAKYMEEIKRLLLNEKNVYEFKENKSDPFYIRSALESIDSIYHNPNPNICIYIPTSQYDVAFFTLLLTIKGQGRFIPAFSTSSCIISSRNNTLVNICRPLFHVSKEEIEFFNSVATRANLTLSEDSHSRENDSLLLLSLENLNVSASETNTFSSSCAGGCRNSMGGSCSKNFEDLVSASNVTYSPSTTIPPSSTDTLYTLINNFLSELQKDSNYATISILSKTAQKLDSSFFTTEPRCIKCPLPDMTQLELCGKCST